MSGGPVTHRHRIPDGHLIINGTRLDVEAIKFQAVFTSSRCAADHDKNGVGTGPLVPSTASLALCKTLDALNRAHLVQPASVNGASSPPWHSIVGRGKPLVPASAPHAPGLGLRSESTPRSLAASQTPLNLAWELIGHSPAPFTPAPVTAPFPCAADKSQRVTGVSPKREDTANETAGIVHGVDVFEVALEMGHGVWIENLQTQTDPDPDRHRTHRTLVSLAIPVAVKVAVPRRIRGLVLAPRTSIALLQLILDSYSPVDLVGIPSRWNRSIGLSMFVFPSSHLRRC